MSRRSVARRLLAVSVLLMLGAVASPVAADEHDDVGQGPVVAVGAEGEDVYAPAEVEVEPGEPVTFVWEDFGHSVTHDADDPAFDSHPDCRQGEAFDVPRGCGAPGTTEQVVLEEPGDYDVVCRLHDDMTGTITVAAAAATSDEDDGSGKESSGSSDADEGGADEDGAESGDADEGGADEEGADEGAASADDDATTTSDGGNGETRDEGEDDEAEREEAEREQAVAAMEDFSVRRESAADVGRAPVPDEGLRQPDGSDRDPEVAEPEDDEPRGFEALRDDAPAPERQRTEPDLEPFPEPTEPDADDEVALPAKDGGDRTLPIALASLGVLGTGAAVLRQVLVTT